MIYLVIGHVDLFHHVGSGAMCYFGWVWIYLRPGTWESIDALCVKTFMQVMHVMRFLRGLATSVPLSRNGLPWAVHSALNHIPFNVVPDTVR